MENVKENLYYTKDHDWVRVEGDKAYVGLTNYAQHHLGSIVYAEAPEVDAEFAKGDAYGVVESVKAATDVNMPVSGKIVEVNEEVVDAPEKFNEDPWGNWFVAVEMSDKAELEELLSAEDYQKLLDEEE
ncbi:glycine cleavage system protein GcvH [Proteiniclasticum sp. QWL-01]|uniref:glycine cleavage system protein GcvH n=1 Tax=Proteiniclasticum sp. QWL-01 TaxID=3036945 RepID=UPI00220CDFE6|nr:glycine cleavage system protein GcvH [Proteiniclasticum sp. QWL-01]UUM10620.1 glycine cleavage system protein GcvH [Clostridiaceae bacterium HFYG-1003]WFF71955.1 glycine cleavage system protein GcvH [Proteiniclasticum sp. QWL-01]